ncbi:40-residue YVTN family beta-propeller repeat-containing protein [Singulisphaera sp. GP187]|uniref:bifunctional YncE family protein/alkaline phosphatase family protein n=1 Tax=Singulisphaera sp. GP187 TaxID=1882752 RepID=UPI000929C0FA|nr:bifunctional YncE family protein/alkaline phosphatase family protein [Singulisphaera sp. GP187]SIO66430.1 40-residue YVTN family beta-propeller repeat-containing protein [Singulisphaera sp. GP187]
MRRRTAARFATLALILAIPLALVGQDNPKLPGPTDKGFLLPNGWTISPVGQQVPLTDLPLNILPLADNRHALVATSGFNAHQLSLIDLKEAKAVGSETALQSWYGLAKEPAGDRVWWSGGGGDRLHTFQLKGPELTRVDEPEAKPDARAKGQPKSNRKFRSGLAIAPDGKTLYSLDIEAGTITAFTPGEATPRASAPAGIRPYDVALVRDGSRLYVSDWAGAAILAIDPTDLRQLAKIPVGIHPNQIAIHPKDDRLFVACASSNSVSVLDLKRGIITETIVTSLFPGAPEGSTPDALAIAPDGETLYVANADNNCVAVIDIEAAGRSQVKGYIPTGWYPTSVAVTPDGKSLLVGIGKGNQTKPNPVPKLETNQEPKETPGRSRRLPFPYIGTTLSGALAIVPIPDDKQLAGYTETVYRNCPYADRLLTNAPYPRKTAIPTKVGEPSPIEHVIYVIKENRTYDQVFGDLPRGNGDPSLVMFGAAVTPNHHALADEFVLLDNLYCNGHVSADGHPWSTMAYNTDYTARNWALTYSARAGISDDEDGDLQKAPSGYLWDACLRNNLTYRSYGEYGHRVSQPDGSTKIEGRVPGLVGHMCPDYGIGVNVRDTDRVETFLKEFAEYEKKGNLPRFIVMSLGEDHTTGTKPGTYTPQACVASNDQALGRLVDAVSHSKLWPKTAIFVIEDDAQNGPDHVDAHRTVGLVISPYTKRHHKDSSQYSTVSMIRTMELILGLPPLSQFDAAARPMFESFNDTPDITSYTRKPAQIDLNAVNDAVAYGADRSQKMDFSEYDRIDDFELNEILWRAIKGENAPLPPAVRRAIAYRPSPVR